jgi:transcriptional regulator with XRE-family HTH domain
MTNQIRLGARLRAARKAAGFNKLKEFSKKLKVPESTYCQHESGAREPSDERLKFYSKTFGVDFGWLKTGEGQPYTIRTRSNKNILEEELIDLKSLKSKNQIIKPELLASILLDLFKSFSVAITPQFAKKIAKSASKAYNKAYSEK